MCRPVCGCGPVCSRHAEPGAGAYDREYLTDMLAEGKRECGECGVHYPEDEMTPLIDHYGEWYRCAPCGKRDFQAYNEAMSA